MTARQVRGGAPRGRPVIALSAIVLGWVCVRAALWDAYPLMPVLPERADYIAEIPMSGQRPTHSRKAQRRAQCASARPTAAIGDGPAAGAAASLPARLAPAPAHIPHSVQVPFVRPMPPPPRPQVQVAATHQMLWMAALAQVPVPLAVLRRSEPVAASAPSYPAGREQADGRRWSADGWLLWRRGGSPGVTGGASPSTYGGSQAGAVVRYRLAPASSHRPALYLRATAPLRGAGKEAAFGVSARPVAGAAVIAAAEMRVTGDHGKVRARPAAMVVTELAPFPLPGKARGEAYLQAGYVGGGGATAFVDGQLRADRSIGRIGPVDLRAGGGVWGGAQKGAARLDIGPAASAAVGLGGGGGARLAVDWRFRVAGAAAPASGPALTLSAGF